MKKKLLRNSLVFYILLNLILVVIPTNPLEGYEGISWKLFVGQVYAIPLLLLFIIISITIYKIKNK